MMNHKPKPILRSEKFRFCCSPEVSCFNECCRNLNQFLTPYDIIRLKNHLGLSSSEFLDGHCRWHIGPETGLPIVTLKEGDPVYRTCRYLSPQGCTVYSHRPSSCRIYPLIRTVGFNPETREATESFMLLKEPHCRGFNEPVEQAIDKWISDQGLTEYNLYNDELMAFISRKRRLLPGPLDDYNRKRVFMALYDLDTLREIIKETGQLEGFEIDKTALASALENDLMLLKLGIQWLNETLFGKS